MLCSLSLKVFLEEEKRERECEKQKRKWKGVVTTQVRREQDIFPLVSEVPRQCSLVLLMEVCFREGKASESDKVKG
jgi:hypothetical protein